MHTPVLLNEVIKALNIKRGEKYIDATIGEGGHILEIAKLGGNVLGIDLDDKQIKNLGLRIKNLDQIKLVQGNFADIEKIARENEFYPVDGILFDLGLSMEQLRSSGKGFSHKNLNELLDMRHDPKVEINAADLINNLDQDELYEIFASYGEEINSLAISKSIVRARPMNNVGELLNAIDDVTPQNRNKTYARIFQALRIKINDELENLKKGLEGAFKIIAKNGRIVVISFHSLEDRTVKRFINKNNLKQVNKKLIKSNNGLSFERSAKLRIITK